MDDVTCIRPDCDHPPAVRGYCRPHYSAARKRGDIKPLRAWKRPAPRDGQVWCCTCKDYRPESEFRWDKTRDDWLRLCRLCVNAAQRRQMRRPILPKPGETEEQAAARRARAAEYMRGWNGRRMDQARISARLRRWGLTEDQYFALFEAQDHKCAICGTESRDATNLAVDHCHESGLIRGLLCRECNMGAGQFMDDPNLLEAAAGYMRSGGIVHDETLRIPEKSQENRRATLREVTRARNQLLTQSTPA